MSEEKNIEGGHKSIDNKQLAKDSQPGTGNQEPETTIQAPDAEPKTENMEVHKHPHHVTHKKKWPEYLLEFLMLFLAVYLGFLTENWREHIVEHKREKQYMVSLLEDLKTDTTQLQTYIGWRQEVNRDFDSIRLSLSKLDSGQHVYFIYKLTNRTTLRFGLPDISERTIQQLKNSGGLRLVRRGEVSNAINRHYLDVNRMKSTYETERLIRMKLVDSRAGILDASLLHLVNKNPEYSGIFRLITKDPVKINLFLNDILAAQQLNRSLLSFLGLAKTNSIQLIQLIQKEYHLE
jgi:hypothetical protein